ncbi:LysR family transcriptional regulator [Bordetella petrii]|uniref:LysR family transcriptional regulator n=1 Tax=Bordetella petrii TaxID=94624 RepID=UPI001A958AB3|nr:LysR family transcriptional regulator [Bordetella petrii]MBO1114389.1 LysR family transcriptional regulator [Bordetella petrii]
MKRKIPSTVALAVFEAAARHENFARAAEELCLSESAVSRQIAALENYLDARLFTRVKKQVVLNDAGRYYADRIAPHLEEIELHTQELMAHRGAGGILELAVIPTFSNRWLLPRLYEFQALHPYITMNFSERPEPFLFRGTNFDAALHFDHPAWTGVVKIELFDEEVVPVISPRHHDLAALREPADLTRVPLLHKATRTDVWRRWFDMVDAPNDRPLPGMRFELYSMVIEAARAGLGVALVPRFYVEQELMRGDLVIPFDIALKHAKRYCLVYPEYKRDSPAVQAFRAWVEDSARRFKSGATVDAVLAASTARQALQA